MRFRIDADDDEHERHVRAAKLCGVVYGRADDVYVEHDHPDDDCTYVAIEGSDTLVNWRDNLDIRMLNGAHRGFVRYAERCVEQYDLVRVLEKNRRVVLTGHSQGAAAALLIAHMLRAHTHNVLEVVLFGCPHVGSSHFLSELLSEKEGPPVFMYRNGDDLVCALPFRVFGFSDALAAHTIVLTPKRIARGLLGRVRAHFIEHYVDSLESKYV